MFECNHVVYVDDRSLNTKLHLTLECGRSGIVNGHEVSDDHCAAAVDGWLRANPGRVLTEFLVTTSRVHHGWFDGVVDVLARHRPRIRHLGLGALTFPDFDRGSHIPDERWRDGSSWSLNLRFDQLLDAVPESETLVVQCSAVERTGPLPEMRNLRRLVLRDTALDPALVADLGAGSFPRLESLDLWLGAFRYQWDGSAQDLVPLLTSTGFANLRHLVVVCDLDEGLIEVLADSPLIARLESLSLRFGVLGAAEATLLHDRWQAFSHLRRLDVTGNCIPGETARALRDNAPGIIDMGYQRIWADEEAYFSPPLVGFFDAWAAVRA
ncbi:hypothetical protein GCM10009557_06960 [Virgisporangium ochraceum]|uniref:Leucine-rich repeat domain-containing protein n=1 Tax=Virgisporangium ochraceum TaxID=65505 RepID=A0A8J3ZZ84_9ACTN|nr:hypothetical protein [Virgisporangium ochraceum]GIJ72767.1 hypothetical protein Voc01_076840 [Virgisporangium ochraceum]